MIAESPEFIRGEYVKRIIFRVIQGTKSFVRAKYTLPFLRRVCKQNPAEILQEHALLFFL